MLLTPKRNSFNQPEPNVWVSLNVMLQASMLPRPAPKVAPASPCGRFAGRSVLRLLVAVAEEHPVAVGQHVVDLDVALVVVPRQRRVDQVVVEVLPLAAMVPAVFGSG